MGAAATACAYPPMMKIFFSASPSSSSSNSTRLAVWCERGWGGVPAISGTLHSRRVVSKKWDSLLRLPCVERAGR